MHLLIRRPGANDWHEPEVSAYTDELHLQALIEASPSLLPGEAQAPVLAAREVSIPDIGSADLVTVDANGRITIVECKLGTNSEMRRTVVGQLLAYAAGLWKQSYEEFDRAFAARTGHPLASAMGRSITDGVVDWDEEEFRRSVEANLESGRFRLVFVVDRITEELKRIVGVLE